jgi:WXXGXW repeat (2 copies)
MIFNISNFLSYPIDAHPPGLSVVQPHKYLLVDGRWEMGDGRWEMGDGRWEMGVRS